MVYAQPRIRPRKCNVQNSLGFCDSNGSFNLGQTTRPGHRQKKKKKRKKKKKKEKKTRQIVGWLVGFYDISTL